jgi:hypothetical protein
MVQTAGMAHNLLHRLSELLFEHTANEQEEHQLLILIVFQEEVIEHLQAAWWVRFV